MTRIEKLEREIQKLSPEELANLRDWFRKYDADAWDRQIEEDVRGGRLDRFAEEALAAADTILTTVRNYYESEDETEILLKRIFKSKVERFIDAVEIAINNIAVEPISIKRDKGLLTAKWQFNKPEEMLFRQQSSDQSKPAEDPINQLKMRFIKGEISEEEYRAKLRILQEK